MKKQNTSGSVKARIKRGDEVVFVAGREFNRYDSEGKRNPFRGKVIAVDPRTRRVKVDGAMIVKKHRKAVPQMNVTGGIIRKEAWVDVSNVAVVDPETGDPSRIKFEIRDGQKVRIAKSGAVVPEPAAFAKIESSTAEPEGTEGETEETGDEKKTEETGDEKKPEETVDGKADTAGSEEE